MTRRPPERGRPASGAEKGPAGARPRGALRPGPRGLGLGGRKRAAAVLVLLTLAFFVVGAKLVAIQGLDSGHYLAVGGSEWEQTVVLPAERGSILDRNGDELGMSIPQTTIYADPHQVSDPLEEALQLAPALRVPVATLQNELSAPKGFVYLARRVPDATASAVTKLNLPGIYELQEPKRFYPAGQLANPLLGSVGTDGTGLGGLEYMYNSVLSGRPGKLIEEIDPQGHQLPGGLQQYAAPVAGQDLLLSIDEPLQYDAEQALAQAIVAAGAQDGIALLMNSKTGEILADAQLAMPKPGNTQPPAVPVHIPGSSGSTQPGGQVQPVEAPSASAFSRVYEPGSVNKLITISAALQTGVIKPTDMFNIPNAYQVAGTWFHDAESHGLEQWDVTDILANSSNIGTIQIAQRLGKDNLLRYIHDYGLGSVTDIGFPGESPGLLPTYWSGTSIADVPIGQGIAVTAIQMLAAYNAIANGGVYVAPRLVDGTIDAQGREHLEPSQPTHRVVSRTVANEMTTMLEQVVQVGTGRAANLDPYTVAGKTGTGLVPLHGGYESGHYVASFAGFVPAENPQITGMVVIDNTPDYGAQASAPTFATIARDALRELGIPPLPKEPPAPGVPITNSQTATAAGEVAGTPLPGLATPPSVVSSPAAAPGRSSSPGSGGPATTAPPTTAPPTTAPPTTAPRTTKAPPPTTLPPTTAGRREPANRRPSGPSG